jgi:hypothetical protein
MWCSHRTWWIIRSTSAIPFQAGVFVIGQSGQTTSSRNEAPSSCFYGHLQRLLGGMILQPALASVALKQKPVARGTRALPLLSTVGSFSPLPSPEFAGDSVVPDVCHLALAAVRASHAVLREDAQNGSKPATTPDGRAVGETAAPWPTSVVPARLFHGAPSDSPVQ